MIDFTPTTFLEMVEYFAQDFKVEILQKLMPSAVRDYKYVRGKGPMESLHIWGAPAFMGHENLLLFNLEYDVWKDFAAADASGTGLSSLAAHLLGIDLREGAEIVANHTVDIYNARHGIKS